MHFCLRAAIFAISRTVMHCKTRTSELNHNVFAGQSLNSTPHFHMPEVRKNLLVAFALSLGFHAGLLALWTSPPHFHRLPAISEPLQVSFMTVPTPPGAKEKERARIADSIPPAPTPEKKLASMPAPPAPTPEEWKLASTYTLKNSKRYRYNWGQLVRSMMGTAVEGPQQGLVRFRIEIAPDGNIAKVEKLWSTSELAETLALKTIRSLPPLPPTPTGKPLVFERTISFEPVEMGWPPVYQYDCLPDPPSFHDTFVWDGSSAQPTWQEHPENALPLGSAPPQAECPPDSTPDSIDAVDKDMKREIDKWAGRRLNGVD
jgi:hypothetical protein